jgi:hypothetical protein
MPRPLKAPPDPDISQGSPAPPPVNRHPISIPQPEKFLAGSTIPAILTRKDDIPDISAGVPANKICSDKNNMDSISKFSSRVSARTIIIVGTGILLLGLACRVGIQFYGRHLYEVMVAEGRAFEGHSFSFDDFVFRIKSGIMVSYVLIACGVLVILAGVVRSRKNTNPHIS